MKANIKQPNAWKNLTDYKKEQLTKFMTDLVTEKLNEELDKEDIRLQKIWLKLAVIVLHDSLNIPEDGLVVFLGNWKRIYRTAKRIHDDDKFKEWLGENVSRVMPSGYPEEFIDSLEDKEE